MRVVIDTSVIINLFSNFYPDRTEVAKKIAILAEEGELVLYSPRLGEFEFISVISRFLPDDLTKEAWEEYRSLIDEFIGESEIIDTIRGLAFLTSHRVPDLYFIATAKHLNAILITNDRKMAMVAKSIGIKTFYLLEEADEFFRFIKTKNR
ncbi:type II toxin-antitoxin system VapC family toxin [Pyrococcus kukulkanii]|uniref:Ribonuclease VapC n=1 Tax=Pyrococcus kukulkanii TaxID=1609559 RepID=A0A127BBX5_9EURY|nr:type II toxin-antitoxin system VapC family toxin [Pyrococcus kukulkanii]AMM54840.1 nucleotide-binding protein [Pyrococcus kukulkanii]RLF90438.1 MAG: PIN domain-containing protein [Thermococci archaeon]